jgi:hypothetical protein
MFASIRRYEFQPGRAAEISRRVQEGFVPIISGAPGFLAYYLVIESGDVGVSVSVFETQAEADVSVRLAADWVKHSLIGLLKGPPELTEGEVTVHKAV